MLNSKPEEVPKRTPEELNEIVSLFGASHPHSSNFPIFHHSFVPSLPGYLLRHLGERLVQNGHHLIDLLIRDDKGRSQE